jgi:hypothetical protein
MSVSGQEMVALSSFNSSSRSCETQLTSFIQELAKNNNDKIQTDVIVMNFAKAFDKVPHKRLPVYKLKYVVAFKMFHEITSYDVLHDFREYTS